MFPKIIGGGVGSDRFQNQNHHFIFLSRIVFLIKYLDNHNNPGWLSSKVLNEWSN